MTKKIELEVNGSPIHLDYFVQSFVDHTTRGVVESLEGTGPFKKLNLTVDGETVKLGLDGKAISTNKFASKIIQSTLAGMVAPLKGVNGAVRKVKIDMEE